jgi:hypothetical protein
MVYSQPFSYSYYPNWEEGISFDDFTKELLNDYLKKYRNVTFRHKRR